MAQDTASGPRIAMDYPVLYGRPVTQAHADYCARRGHALYEQDGVVAPYCPRCGESTRAPEPAEWEVALMQPPAITPGLCTAALCTMPATHTDPVWSAAGLNPYRCALHADDGVHVLAAPRLADAAIEPEWITRYLAHNGDDSTPTLRLSAALMRDAWLTPAERATRKAVSRDRYAQRYHGTTWDTLTTGTPA